MKKINWKLEGRIINQYSDYTIKENKTGVLDYLGFIMAINTKEELYTNEKGILNRLDKNTKKKWGF